MGTVICSTYYVHIRCILCTSQFSNLMLSCGIFKEIPRCSITQQNIIGCVPVFVCFHVMSFVLILLYPRKKDVYVCSCLLFPGANDFIPILCWAVRLYSIERGMSCIRF